MAKNYAALANDVVSALGGKDNIVAVTHCMTRLRFVLKDETLTDAARLKSISGVLGVVRNDNQCQVIIGNTVSQAYREVISLLPTNLQPVVPEGPQKMTLRRIGAGILDALIGTMLMMLAAPSRQPLRSASTSLKSRLTFMMAAARRMISVLPTTSTLAMTGEPQRAHST